MPNSHRCFLSPAVNAGSIYLPDLTHQSIVPSCAYSARMWNGEEGTGTLVDDNS